MTLARKLGLLVTIPLIAVVAFAALALYTTAGQAIGSDDLTKQVELAGTAGKITRNLHKERVAALALLAPDPTTKQQDDFRQLTAATDTDIAEYHRGRVELSTPPGHLVDVVARIDDQLDDLPSLREQVLTGKNANLSAITFRYRILAADLGTYREGVATGAPIEVADQIRTAALLTRITEVIGLQQVAVLRAYADGLTPALDEEVRADRSASVEAARAFSSVAPTQWQSWYDVARVGPAALAAQVMDDDVARTAPGDRLTIDPTAWREAMDSRIASLGQVEQQVDGAVLASVVDYRNSQWWLTVIEAAAVLVTLAAATILAVRLGTPMIRGLRRLRTAAHSVAYERLPAAVSELNNRKALGSATPREFAQRAGSAVEIRGSDEIAQVGAAFNELNQSALHLAAQQAELRDQVDSIFVALARRAELLTSALVTQVDLVEQGEQDPDRLAQLFTLDNLVTRMRRTNNSLLVLGGEASARIRGDAMSCHDLLNAAASQIERYAQVDIRSEVDELDVDLVVATEVADHLAHLIAELIDNATTFSAPGSRVLVHARPVEDRVVVTVTDHGIGFQPDTLAAANARLATPTLDVSVVRAMGLTVVGHIASWYGIRVSLRSLDGATEVDRGTVATIVLPPNVFREGMNFDWFRQRQRAAQAARAAPRETTDNADRRDSATVSGVMTAFARGIGAHRTNGAGPDTGEVNLVEQK